MEEFIRIDNLSKCYSQGVMAVDDLSLTLPKGKIIGLLGPNGSGKTTLIKMMCGILKPTGGNISIDGMPVGEKTKGFVAYLPDCNFLPGRKRIIDIVNYYADFYDDFSKEKAGEMLEALQINPKDRFHTMSKGTKEKVQLVLVMSRSAKLYVLDEPIAGVDPAARDYILRTIINNYNPEASVIISTHLISDIESVLDEVVFIKYGKLNLHATVDEIRDEKEKSVDAYFREVFAC